MSVGPTCCDFLPSANVPARSSLWVCAGRGHMPCPDHHAVTLTVADVRRWMQRRKINSRVIRAAGAWPRARSAFLNPGILGAINWNLALRPFSPWQLELLHEMAPSAQTIGFLINATNPYVELDVQDVAAASDRLRRKLVVLRVATRNDLEQTFATVEDRGVSALIRASDPFLCVQRDQVIALANQIGIPKPLKIKRMNAP